MHGQSLIRVGGVVLLGIGVVTCARRFHHADHTHVTVSATRATFAPGQDSGCSEATNGAPRSGTSLLLPASDNAVGDNRTRVRAGRGALASDERGPNEQTRTDGIASEELVRIVPEFILADSNHDGALTVDDIDLFSGHYESGSEKADFNGDGVVDQCDFDGYLAAFDSGESLIMKTRIRPTVDRQFGVRLSSDRELAHHVHLNMKATVRLPTGGSGNSTQPSP